MLKAGVYALALLGLFALVFAFLPAGRADTAQTGAALQGVALTLYPARDADAVWRFRASEVTSDPLKGETHLAGLSDGGRWVRERGANGQPTGRAVLDATLKAPDLTIDSQDNMLTRQARITLVQQCADIDLRGTPGQPVRVEQGYGFSAPRAVLDSPFLTGEITRLRMSFQFQIDDSGEDSRISAPLDPTETCKNGRRVPLADVAPRGDLT
ncbi:hypothetical protein DEIPH_ctg008orf0025 [Deinococcus phoenicis]|uniref:Uncharacterized protein n=1 Tax=Deinococcus phoenicis TaxID=1476583 RepID=A0A016QT61_9DEIO|nr:hypothetical protein [Deinococcus phoenicis]EYB69315.1 hypothetical protein DEIPH_ctg008orf0025 [Deinococcus phoenicis]